MEKRSFLLVREGDVDKKSRIKRLNDAVFKHGVVDINEISDIPEKIRGSLNDKFSILSFSEKERNVSADGTVKFLFELNDGSFIEAVFLSDSKNRVTMCISTQVGCRMGCKFCRTGQMGLRRNMTWSEITEQVIFIYRYMIYERNINTRVFNIVYMGMGEPFDNYDNLVKSVEILTAKEYFHLHPSWITVSTCGIMDMVEPILELFPRLRVAVSLNSTIESKRAEMMPVTNKYSIKNIADTLKRVYQKYGRRLLLEYVLIKDFNDGTEDANGFELFNDKAFHVNLIPLNNSFDGYCSPSDGEVQEFLMELKGRGIFVTRRTRRGADIQADCGQLAGGQFK